MCIVQYDDYHSYHCCLYVLSLLWGTKLLWSHFITEILVFLCEIYFSGDILTFCAYIRVALSLGNGGSTDSVLGFFFVAFFFGSRIQQSFLKLLFRVFSSVPKWEQSSCFLIFLCLSYGFVKIKEVSILFQIRKIKRIVLRYVQKVEKCDYWDITVLNRRMNTHTLTQTHTQSHTHSHTSTHTY